MSIITVEKSMTFDIPTELIPISANDFYSGQHWTKRQKIAAAWHLSIFIMCKQNRLPRVKRCKLIFDFKDITPEKNVCKKYACTNCRGEVDAVSYAWYELGKIHERNKM